MGAAAAMAAFRVKVFLNQGVQAVGVIFCGEI
jgi:hypothetical protein